MLHIPVITYSIMPELGPVTPLVPGAMPSLGIVELGFTLGSGIFVLGKGIVTAVVGVVARVVGALVVCVPVVSVAGALLLQAQAHRESASTIPKMKMPIFFILLLLSV